MRDAYPGPNATLAPSYAAPWAGAPGRPPPASGAAMTHKPLTREEN